MDYPVLKAKDRNLTGKGVARKVRALGFVPAVVYGATTAARSIVVEPKPIAAILMGGRSVNTVVQLDIEGAGKTDTCLAVIRQFQLHPVKRCLEHCDFLVVDEKTEMTVKVPVRTIGKSEGEKLGAKMNIALREVTLKCKAGDVPEAVVVDVTPLGMGAVLTLSQLPYPAGTRPVYQKDRAVITVRMPKAEKEEEAAAGAEGAAAGTAAPAKAEAAAEAPKK